MAFGSDSLKGFFGSDFLKDYTHASKTFRANGYELAPKYKFLFYVRFSLNTTGIPALRELFPAGTSNEISAVVKTTELPGYTFDVETMNQYNRKRLVQTKINYEPVRIVFHDDSSNLITNMWYNYFSYYYKDPTHKYQNVPVINGSVGELGALSQSRTDYNGRDTYIAERDQNEWGYVGESYSDATGGIPSGGKPRFFNDITIYSMNQHKFSQYTLINPIITEWRHDTHDYSEETGMMEHSMQISYETVKYYSGDLDNHVNSPGPDSMVKGFADPTHYDTVPSSITPRVDTGSTTGPGRILNQQTRAGSITDPTTKTILGSAQRGGTVGELEFDPTLRQQIPSESNQVFQGQIRNQLAGGTETFINKNTSAVFAKTSGTTNPLAGQTNTPRSAEESVSGPQTSAPTAPRASTNPRTTNVFGAPKKYKSQAAAEAAARNVDGWPRAYAARAVIDNGDGTFSVKPKTDQNKKQVLSER